jgi:hypothetical protein
VADDIYDVDALHQAATVRLDQQARRIIDSHQYVLDVDLDQVPVPIDHDAQQLLNQHQRLQRDMAVQEATVQEQRRLSKAVEPKWRATNGDGVTRPRWKFIAQTGTLLPTANTDQTEQSLQSLPAAKRFLSQLFVSVNTRQLKRSKQKHSSYVNASALNTLVEENGTLRNGTMQELTTVAWKLPRHTQEHLYAGAKRGWLDRVHNRKRNDNGAAAVAPWGKAASPSAVVVVATTVATTTTPQDNAAEITAPPTEAEPKKAPDAAQAANENDTE